MSRGSRRQEITAALEPQQRKRHLLQVEPQIQQQRPSARTIAAWLLGGLIALVGTIGQGPASAQAEEISGNSRIVGKVFAANGKRGLAGATVVAYHLSTKQLHRSPVTKANGEFLIGDLPLGYYDLAVETPEGFYVGNQVVNVRPDGKAIVHFRVTPAGPATPSAQLRSFPGTDTSPAGVAQVTERVTGRDFWRSPKGVGVLAGAGGAVLLAIAVSSDDEPFASQF